MSHSSPIDPNTKFGKNVRLSHYAVIEENCEIGDNTFIGNFVVIKPNTKIGKDCVIGHNTVIEGDCQVGDRVLIHAHCHIDRFASIEDDVFIAAGFLGSNTAKIKHGRNYPLVMVGYTIKRAARIAIGVLVLPGVTIGENALVGAGAVVTKDVPPLTKVMGVPAKIKEKVKGKEILMKVVAMIYTHNRPFILPATIHHLKQQTYPVADIVIVGSCEVDEKVAGDNGCIYVNAPNNPLGAKAQTGLEQVRELNPDILLIDGDDDWLSPNWCEFFLPYLKDFGIVGSSVFHMLKVRSGKPLELAVPVYKGTLGQGRMWSRKALDLVEWKVWPNHITGGLDGHSQRSLISRGGKMYCHKGEEAKVLGIKGWWGMKDPYDHLKRRDKPALIDNPEAWLKTHFPYFFEWKKEHNV